MDVRNRKKKLEEHHLLYCFIKTDDILSVSILYEINDVDDTATVNFDMRKKTRFLTHAKKIFLFPFEKNMPRKSSTTSSSSTSSSSTFSSSSTSCGNAGKCNTFRVVSDCGDKEPDINANGLVYAQGSLIGVFNSGDFLPLVTGNKPIIDPPSKLVCDPKASSQTTPPAVGATATFQAGNAGSVSIKRTASTTLTVVSTSAAIGWTSSVTSASGRQVTVIFNNSTTGEKDTFSASLDSKGTTLTTTNQLCHP